MYLPGCVCNNLYPYGMALSQFICPLPVPMDPLPPKNVPMKQILLAFLVVCLFVQFAAAQRACESQNYLRQELLREPGLSKRMEAIERSLLPLSVTDLVTEGTDPPGAVPVIRIPVVVHIVYASAGMNISDAQVRSQLEVLNLDFRKLNTDTLRIPSVFKGLAADCRITFALATTDPTGRATSGIIRKKTGIQYFGLDDRIKSTARGGADGWDADQYLNIWVAQLAGGLIGYASPVGGAKGTDGVVISYSAFGTMGTATAPYHKGRTATHEVGHWLGLRHIWGDTYCGNDYVDDTPPQRNSTNGCPSGMVTTCDNSPFGDMYMNYMDLTDDACIVLFTRGQVARMRKLFLEDGPRHTLLASNGCSDNPLPAAGPLPEENTEALVLRAYPNPASDLLNISSDAVLTGKPITIHNHAGLLVMRTTLPKAMPQLRISHLQDGIYYVSVPGCSKPVKFIKAGSR